MKHGCKFMTLRLSSRCSGSRHIHRGWKKRVKFVAMSSPCWSFFVFDIQGIAHKEFVPPDQSVNGKFYCEILKRLRKGIWRKRPDKWKKNNWFLQLDNAPTHTSLFVRQFLTSKHITVISHPNCLPDLAPCDFFLFPKMKLQPKWCRSDMTEEIHAELKEVIDTLTFENFQECMK